MVFDFFSYFFLFLWMDLFVTNAVTDLGVYFLMHFFHNCLVSYYTLANVYHVFSSSYGRAFLSKQVVPLIYAFHVYHIFRYIKYFRPDDWYHHIFSMAIAVPLTFAYFDQEDLLGMCFFFTTGFPGGINYLLLFLSKNNCGVSKRTQQKCNTLIQSWIRCPGIVMNSGFVAKHVCEVSTSFTNQLSGFIIFFILLWNGIYFQNIVLENYYAV